MKNGVFLIFSLLLLLPAFAQLTIKGKVVTSANGTPVPGSSVFITNTSKGTTADKDGYFELNNVPAGKHELIISSIGYETNVFSFSSEELPLQVRVELQLKVKELENVTVEPFVEEGWDRWGKVFLDNFIGSTANAAHCKIKNEKAIRFRYFKKSNRLVAFTDEPVVVENKALGYIIKFQLEDFEVNFKEHTSVFLGYPFFEEIDKNRKGLQNKWQRNRDKAFYGSMIHFMRSIYNNRLAADGFEVKRMRKIPNEEKERVRKIMRAAARPVTEKNSPVKIVIGKGGSSSQTRGNDSTEYYHRIMRQSDFIDAYGKDLLTADSIIINTKGNYKVVFFTDYLYIMFKGELEEQEYLNFFNENRNPFYQRSYIILMSGEPIAIDVNGNYYPAQRIYAGAYWGWSEKIAGLLPLDYKPGEEK